MALDKVELGKVLVEVRILRCLTQKAVAEHTGLTRTYLSLLEHGQRAASTDTLNRLAEVYRVPAEWLLFMGSIPNSGDEFAELTETTKAAMRAAIKYDTAATP
jgi:transcriptional regulator with XRE-family HTH domain